MIIEFMDQFFNILMVGAIKKAKGFDKENNKTVYCIAVFSGNMQILCEFKFDTVEEQEKAYKKLANKIRKASASIVVNTDDLKRGVL